MLNRWPALERGEDEWWGKCLKRFNKTISTRHGTANFRTRIHWPDCWVTHEPRFRNELMDQKQNVLRSPRTLAGIPLSVAPLDHYSAEFIGLRCVTFSGKSKHIRRHHCLLCTPRSAVLERTYTYIIKTIICRDSIVDFSFTSARIVSAYANERQ